MKTEWPDLLEKARVDYKDGLDRQADFHALRYTLCTNLARAGVAVQTAMQLMRHSDIKLTTKVYMDAGQLPTANAMTLVPRFTTVVAGAVRVGSRS